MKYLVDNIIYFHSLLMLKNKVVHKCIFGTFKISENFTLSELVQIWYLS